MAGSDKTEKATPKKRDDARKKGQVARSMDVNGAVVLMSALLALSSFAPMMFDQMELAMRALLAQAAVPSVVEREGIAEVLVAAARPTALATAPVVFVCLVAGVLTSVGQVGIKPMPGALKPDPRKLNPLTGAKNLFGTRAIFETVKNVAKVAAVAAVALLSLLPQLDELAALVGMPAQVLLPMLAKMAIGIAQKAAVAYLVIAAADWFYQRYRHDKSLKMDKQEVKDEYKQQELPAEVKGAQKRRAAELTRARMMDAVPTADVIVTNPTHYSVALRYSAEHPAPTVVAKGQDLVALRIREIAAEHGVAVVPDPPLARSLHATVEVNQMIPEELFQAVAQLLAYVYRVAGARYGSAAA
jgi:flagellar biosynthetic protein FlhB